MDKRMNRPSPSTSATLYPVGHTERGNDGNMWIIVSNKKNVKRWQINTTKKKSRKRKSRKRKRKFRKSRRGWSKSRLKEYENKYENIDKISIKNFKGLWKPQTKPINKMTKKELIKKIISFRDEWWKINAFAFVDQDEESLNSENLNELRKKLKYYYSDENKKIVAENLNLI